MRKLPTMFANGLPPASRLAALERKPQSRPSHVRKLDGQADEARFAIALACSDPPEGFACWTLQAPC